MTWQEVVALLAEHEVGWFLGPIGLVLALIILVWVWRTKRNGNGTHKNERIDMLEKDVAAVKEGMKNMLHWADQSAVTQQRMLSEMGEFRGQMKSVLRVLEKEQDSPPRH